MCEQNLIFVFKLKLVLHVMFKVTGCEHKPQPTVYCIVLYSYACSSIGTIIREEPIKWRFYVN